MASVLSTDFTGKFDYLSSFYLITGHHSSILTLCKTDILLLNKKFQ